MTSCVSLLPQFKIGNPLFQVNLFLVKMMKIVYPELVGGNGAAILAQHELHSIVTLLQLPFVCEG